jgi:hypothetical protein
MLTMIAGIQFWTMWRVQGILLDISFETTEVKDVVESLQKFGSNQLLLGVQGVRQIGFEGRMKKFVRVADLLVRHYGDDEDVVVFATRVQRVNTLVSAVSNMLLHELRAEASVESVTSQVNTMIVTDGEAMRGPCNPSVIQTCCETLGRMYPDVGVTSTETINRSGIVVELI